MYSALILYVSLDQQAALSFSLLPLTLLSFANSEIPNAFFFSFILILKKKYQFIFEL